MLLDHVEQINFFAFFLNTFFMNREIVLDYHQFTDTGKAWPPYFPDLSPCDFFLWSALKDAVYRNNPTSLDESLNSACDSISVEALQDMESTFIVRLRHLIVSNGEQFEKIVLWLQRLLHFIVYLFF